mmetsp:Transcript_5779/g.17054  ORF Transcript_5779/g.17054 Transcript_5779/m.17054 type:complete len:308 (+) Transcript_5779:57-980(+)
MKTGHPQQAARLLPALRGSRAGPRRAARAAVSSFQKALHEGGVDSRVEAVVGDQQEQRHDHQCDGQVREQHAGVDVRGAPRGPLRLQDPVPLLCPLLLLFRLLFIGLCLHPRALVQLLRATSVQEVIQHDRGPLAGQQNLPQPSLPPNMVGPVIDRNWTRLSTRSGQLLPSDRVSVGVLACKLHRLSSPLVKCFEGSLLFPEILVFFVLFADCTNVGPTSKPEGTFLISNDLGNALVPHVVQRHGLASERDLHFPPIVIARKADMERLMQVANEVDQHLYRVCIRKPDPLLGFRIINLGVLDSSPLI